MYNGARWRLNTNGRFSKFIERGWEIFFMEEKESNDLMSKKVNTSKEYITQTIYKYIKNT